MKTKKQNRLFISFMVSFVCVTVMALIQQIGGLSFLERKTFDIRVQLRNEQGKGSDDIIIILIDEASLESMKPLVGRWPWPRTLYAELNNFLSEQGAKVVLYDILFTEPQIPRDKNGELGPDDIDLVTSSIENGHVIHAVQLLKEPEDEEKNRALGRPLPDSFVKQFSLEVEGLKQLFNTGNNNYYLPLPELYENISGIGIVEFMPDNDGVFRRTKLLRSYQGNLFPALSLASLVHLFPDNKLSVNRTFLFWGTTQIPLLENGDYLVNPKKEFQTLSMGGVLSTIQQIQQGHIEHLIVNPALFKDKIVLIGASAVGVEDLKPTPYGPNYPGVFLHASIISNLIERDYIKKSPFLVELIITFLIAFLIAWIITSGIKISIKSTVPLLIIFIYLFVANSVFSMFRIWIAVVFPIIGGMLSVYAASFIYMAFTEGAERLKTRRMFSQYVSPSILSKVMESETLTAEIGVTKELTILFSDIRGFTSISETMESRKVVEMLNYYLHEMVELVFKHKGTLDKFIGDAVMAFWGAPIESEHHARQTVSCALEMIERLKIVNIYFARNNFPEIKIGIGMNTGPVIVGNIGSTKRLDYTVIGDNVNLASRVEGLTKNYGCSILLAETTAKTLGDQFICRVVDRVQVKGKKESIMIYEPLVNPNSQTDEKRKAERISEMAEIAFNAYQKMDWDVAEKGYLKILGEKTDDPVSKIFIHRCQEFRSEPPPPNWGGCYVFTSK